MTTPGSPPQPLKFPRDARLLAGIDFVRVFEQGRRLSHPLMSLHFLAAPEMAGAQASPQPAAPTGHTAARLGLAVSRKVDGRAVVRNRIKRRLREQFRQLRPQLAPGDYVVVARRDAASADGPALAAAFRQLLQRHGALPRPAAGGTMAGSPSSPG